MQKTSISVQSVSKNVSSLCSCKETCFVWQVVSVNPADKTVKLNDGTLQNYDQLLISTGCRLESSSCSLSFQ